MGLLSLWTFFRVTRPGTNPQPAAVHLTPLEREEVEWRISEFLSDPTSIHAHLHDVVGRENVLPLTFDWTHFMALRPDGAVVWIPYDHEPGPIEPVREERLRNMGLFQGSKLHPDLQFLLPRKPPDATTCPDCRGTGQVTLPEGREALSVKLICYCGGLGWVPQTRDRRKAIVSWLSMFRAIFMGGPHGASG